MKNSEPSEIAFFPKQKKKVSAVSTASTVSAKSKNPIVVKLKKNAPKCGLENVFDIESRKAILNFLKKKPSSIFQINDALCGCMPSYSGTCDLEKLHEFLCTLSKENSIHFVPCPESGEESALMFGTVNSIANDQWATGQKIQPANVAVDCLTFDPTSTTTATDANSKVVQAVPVAAPAEPVDSLETALPTHPRFGVYVPTLNRFVREGANDFTKIPSLQGNTRVDFTPGYIRF